MSPQLFDELVVRYDTPLMELAKRRGRFVAVHCHGRIRHALQRFREMGVDQTDPVEQPPDGEVTLAEARAISEGRITLTEISRCARSPRFRRMPFARGSAPSSRAGPAAGVTTTGTPLESILRQLRRTTR
jgi:hypothetical protein